MRIVSDAAPVIDMYVSENQISAVEVGQVVRFFPDVPHAPPVKGTVTSIDKTPIRQIQQPLLSSTFGGRLAAFNDPKEGLVAYDAVFRVQVRPVEGATTSNFMVGGTARVETDLRFISENLFARAISIVIRESGF